MGGVFYHEGHEELEEETDLSFFFISFMIFMVKIVFSFNPPLTHGLFDDAVCEL